MEGSGQCPAGVFSNTDFQKCSGNTPRDFELVSNYLANEGMVRETPLPRVLPVIHTAIAIGNWGLGCATPF
jgi:hypothetical protein